MSYTITKADTTRGRPLEFRCDWCRQTWPVDEATEDALLVELRDHRCDPMARCTRPRSHAAGCTCGGGR